MWDETNFNKAPTLGLNKVSAASSSHLCNQTHRPKIMEEVWNDINLASLHDHSSREAFSVNSNPHIALQDFLARPLTNDPPTNRANSMLYGCPRPPPATVLSLNSDPGFDFLDNVDPLKSTSRLQTSPISTVHTFNCPFEALAHSSSLASFGKRVQEADNSNSDRRHKRMIKNRESAARSRARKQAYTTELELEVAHLMEENAKLRKQQEQLRVTAASQFSRKHTLQRTSTAPF
ncbi:Protein FD [Hibiscus syriacus]|uniref:Protein FD n=1 Tax=Hibiscus syriacus TaxID=106335 RepID=A0A6A3AVN7_HIBSY|nr:protein FD-like [Hibiscus syriacus]KAE8707145.1 Protein FD [Hibiscus syriacus]